MHDDLKPHSHKQRKDPHAIETARDIFIVAEVYCAEYIIPDFKVFLKIGALSLLKKGSDGGILV